MSSQGPAGTPYPHECRWPEGTFSERHASVHLLKVWPEFFEAIADGSKTFELRRDDREPRFEVGDLLRLAEWDPILRLFTDRVVERRVSYVLTASQAAKLAVRRDLAEPGRVVYSTIPLQAGWVVLGLERVKASREPLQHLARAMEQCDAEEQGRTARDCAAKFDEPNFRGHTFDNLDMRPGIIPGTPLDAEGIARERARAKGLEVPARPPQPSPQPPWEIAGAGEQWAASRARNLEAARQRVQDLEHELRVARRVLEAYGPPQGGQGPAPKDRPSRSSW